ncbi:hypothetical protein MKX03_012882 [Papaver bracteatum]|nr:hypothetical protein MKX03_012882 [Papaver bracteatum]
MINFNTLYQRINNIFETGSNSSSCSEIEEIDADNNNSSIRKETNIIGFLSFNDKHTVEYHVTSSLSGAQNIYVAVGGKLNSSLDALRWTLRHHPLTMRTINLIHVFPEVIFITSPFGGRVPKDQVSPEELENYMSQQRHKRREFLQKFLDVCSIFKVNVETLLIESNSVAKAVADLIEPYGYLMLWVPIGSNFKKIMSLGRNYGPEQKPMDLNILFMILVLLLSSYFIPIS